MPRAGSGLTTARAPATGGAVADDREHRVAARRRAARATARSSSRAPSTTSSAFGVPIRRAGARGEHRAGDPRRRRTDARMRVDEPCSKDAADAFADPAAVAAALDGAGYLPDDGVATAAFLAMRMAPAAVPRGRPGRRQDRAGAGAGRRSPARSWSGCSATRASTPARRSTTGTSRGRCCTCAPPATAPTAAQLEASLYDRRFLVARPILQALETHARRCCWSTRSTAPTTSSRRSCSRCSPTTRSRSRSSGRSAPTTPPLVVLTSNRTREVHDALKRRCLYHWVEHPTFEREVEIVRAAHPGGQRAAGPRGRRGGRRAARGRPAQAARRRRDDRLDAGAARARQRAGSTAQHADRHPRRGGEVPRGPGARASATLLPGRCMASGSA